MNKSSGKEINYFTLFGILFVIGAVIVYLIPLSFPIVLVLYILILFSVGKHKGWTNRRKLTWVKK